MSSPRDLCACGARKTVGARTCRACYENLRANRGRPSDDRTSWEKRGHRHDEGYRDRYCPVCGAGPFVRASYHMTRIHPEHPQTGDLVSREHRAARREVAKDNPAWREGRHGPAKTIHARRRRWARQIVEERSKGIQGYRIRLARRWRLTKGGADDRIATVAALGLVNLAKAPHAAEDTESTDAKAGRPS